MRRDMIRLKGEPESVADARHRVAEFLAQIPGCSRVDDIVLMVSELVTNALLHTDSGNGGTVELTILEERGQIRVEVKDQGSGQVPKVLRSGLDDKSGRGLSFVDMFADYWDWSPGGSSSRVVWFEVWPELASAGGT